MIVSEKIQVFNIDCMELLADTPDGYYDLAIVDPPYGINATKMQMGSHPNRGKEDGSGPSTSTAVKVRGRLNSGSGKLKNRILNRSDIDWDNEVPNDRYFEELFRVSKNQIIWGGNYFSLPPTRGIVVWDKMQPWENFSQVELAWTSFDTPAKLYKQSNTGGANDETKIHPTQKPIALYRYLLKKFAAPNMKILDTHVGSGSSAIACYQFGCEFHGTERQEFMFNQMVDRVKRWCKPSPQINMFNEHKAAEI